MNLYFLNGNKKGEHWKLVPPGICIGREEDNDIQLLTPGISRYHVKIDYNTAEKIWQICDLGSTNGTKINGVKITTPQKLKKGDEIQIGEQVILFDESFMETKNAPATVVSPVASPLKIKELEKPGKSTQQIPVNTNIFGGKKEEPSTSAEEPSSRKKIANLLFALLVTILACGSLLIFGMLNNPPEKNKNSNAGKQINIPFLLVYEKQQISKDNVFRFYVRIENNGVIFKLDDLKGRRHFSKGIGELEKDILKRLVDAVKDTNFMNIKNEPPGKPDGDVDEIRSMTICYNTNLNNIIIQNTYPPTSFEQIEHAIESFAEDHRLKTIALSEKEMLEEAERSFVTAEELFQNYQARPENLRNAIMRYKITVDSLEQFDPKPRNYDIAKRKLNEAENLRQKMIKDIRFNANLYLQKKQYAEAISECSRLLMMLDPEEALYSKIRDNKIALERLLSNQNKKGRRR